MSRAPRIPLRRTIGDGWRLVLRRWGGWLLLAGLLQAAVVLVAAPLLQAAAGAGLRAAGVASLTTETLSGLLRSPLGLAILLAVAVLAVTAVAVQAIVLVTAAWRQRADAAEALPSPRALAGIVGRRLLALVRRPSSLLLVPYLLLLVPLGHAALGSAITNWIAIPSFIGGELQKTAVGAIAYPLGMLVVWYLNLRLLLVLPILAVGDGGVPAAVAASWRATRWQTWRILVLVIVVVAPLAVVVVGAGALSVAATAIADAAAPTAAPVVAAVGFGIAQTVAFLAVALAASAQAQLLVGAVRATAVVAADPEPVSTVALRPRTRAVVAAAAVVASVAAAGAIAVAWYPTLDRVDDGATLVIAHRGDTTAAVENTIPALEAAAAAGADLVEFDVQQTRDGDWVVMHDFELTRLTGSPGAVADMTIAEATALTVRAGGHEARVPSMREFVRRAVELGQPMLIEIKPHGGETADFLDRFFAILQEEGAMETSLFHSLSSEVVAGQERLHPEALVGLILPLNVGGVPETPADFVVVEDWSYTPALRDAVWASNRGLLVWTVNDEATMRRYLREPVDGIITDVPVDAEQQRQDIADDTSLASRLLDALGRLTVAF